MTFAATVLAVTASGEITSEPSAKDAATAGSLHVLAFSSKGHLLLNESEGAFDFDTWDKVYEIALGVCHGGKGGSSDGDVAMVGDLGGQQSPLESFVRETVEDQIYRDYSWKVNAAD